VCFFLLRLLSLQRFNLTKLNTHYECELSFHEKESRNDPYGHVVTLIIISVKFS